LRLNGGGETFVFPFVECLCGPAGTGPKRAESIGTELTPEGKNIDTAEQTIDRPFPRRSAHERRSAVRTI
jgi:hypothetical protein